MLKNATAKPSQVNVPLQCGPCLLANTSFAALGMWGDSKRAGSHETHDLSALQSGSQACTICLFSVLSANRKGFLNPASLATQHRGLSAANQGRKVSR